MHLLKEKTGNKRPVDIENVVVEDAATKLIADFVLSPEKIMEFAVIDTCSGRRHRIFLVTISIIHF